MRVSAENSIKISTLISKNSIISKMMLRGLSNNSKKLSILRFSSPQDISISLNTNLIRKLPMADSINCKKTALI